MMESNAIPAPLAGPDGCAGPTADRAPVTGTVAALAAQGWSVTPDFLEPDLVAVLRQELTDAWTSGAFRRAGVGRGAQREFRPEVRTDWVRWLDPQTCSAAQGAYLAALERLRQALNAALYLGLFEFEAHQAVYPPGSYYRKHLDQFIGIGARRVSCILYLNADWQADDGGQLRLYTDAEVPDRHVDILPTGGTLATFLSARFLHEVLPARRARMSITGWFSTRG
ncbi:MAG: 2OG-Fe(II) oxygenase family protein [Pseudomonadota bacterium]